MLPGRMAAAAQRRRGVQGLEGYCVRLVIGTTLGICGALLLLVGCGTEGPPGEPADAPTIPRWGDEPPLYYVRPASITDLLEMQTWYFVENGCLRVPNVAPVSFPEELDRLPSPIKKRIFFRSLLPLVLYENQRLERQRERLLRLLDPDGLVSPSQEQSWLQELMKTYKVRRPAGRPLVLSERLLPRVDIIPPELVLAQAAIESGWGTSRFFRLGKAVFGEWTHDPLVRGLVPAKRDSGATHRVRAFTTLLASLRAYMRNLNTNPAYREFRQLRSTQRLNGEQPNAYDLAEMLTRYSARGRDYIADLRTLLQDPELAKCSKAEFYTVGLPFVTRFEIVEVEGPWGTISAWPQ